VKQLRSLEAWNLAQQLARAAYHLTLQPPLCRHFGLADQIRRSAVSIPANIVEGYALGTTIQFVRCLRIALASAAELTSHLEIARDVGLVPREPADRVANLAQRVLRLIVGLLRKLGAKTPARPFPLPQSPFPVTKPRTGESS
jgi:four helix bundle protein